MGDPASTVTPIPTHRRWVGVLLSFLIPGCGIFLAGKRKTGLRWFLGLGALWLARWTLGPLPIPPGLSLYLGLSLAYWALGLWMLVLSFKPVPRLGVKGWILIMLLTGVLAGVQYLLPRPFTRPFGMPTKSMVPTILPGDHLLVQTSAYWFGAPRRGEVVAFQTDAMESSMVPKNQIYLKRVAGLPGEVIQIIEGRLIVNGRPLLSPPLLAGTNFSMLQATSPPGGTNTYVVPAHAYFVLGDNGTNSLDSRYYGAVPRQSIIGRATKIYWPWARAGDIR